VATPGVSFSYDPAYSRVMTMVDGTGTTSYTYHPVGVLGAGQVASVDGPLDNDTIAYQYDELGRVLSRTLGGVARTEQYDELGRVTTEVNALGTFTYGYDGATGRLASVAYPNGQTSVYSYMDNLHDRRLQTIHHKKPDGTTLSKFDYTYDVAGNILTWRQQAESVAVQWEYGYDRADQLTAATKRATDPQATILNRYVYAYDLAGNRLSEQIDDAVTSATHDALNRLQTQTPGGMLMFRGQINEPGTVTIQGKPATVFADNRFQGAATVVPGTNQVTIVATDASGNKTTQSYEVDVSGTPKTFTYDANGNMTGDGTRTFEWDARNELTALSVGTRRSEFTYDGARRRVRVVEKEGGTVQSDIRQIWCGAAICEERSADGSVIRPVPARGEQVGSVPHYFAGDHLGNVTDVTDASGTSLARYAFDPWGRRTSGGPADVTRIGFTGHRWQATGDLWLTLHRAYDPEVGRWLSQDPVGGDRVGNSYAYIGNRTLNRFDPLGLQSVKCDDSCDPAQKEAAKQAAREACARVSQPGGECRAALQQYGVLDKYQSLCRNGFKIVCIKKGQDCGGCGGPCNPASLLAVQAGTVFLQSNASGGDCGSLANTIAHELAHSAGIGLDGLWRSIPAHAENLRKANDIAAKCAGQR
jgi:RHS repeat-associated protein